MRYLKLCMLLAAFAFVSCRPLTLPPISATPEPGPLSTHIPGIHFLRQKPVDGERDYPAGLTHGEFVLKDGCLLGKSPYSPHDSDAGYITLVWPFDFNPDDDADGLVVRDGDGQIVARVGDEIAVGGGASPAATIGHFTDQPLPAVCPDFYWIVSDIVANLTTYRFEDLSVLVARMRESRLPIDQQPTLVGTLSIVEECLVVEDGGSDRLYLVVWPLDFSMTQQDGELQVIDGEGQAVARVGEKVRLQVGVSREASSYIGGLLRERCFEPFWVVTKVSEIR